MNYSHFFPTPHTLIIKVIFEWPLIYNNFFNVVNLSGGGRGKNRIMVCHTFVVIFCEEQDHEQGGNWPRVTLLGGMKND